jgi:hypothetical protein
VVSMSVPVSENNCRRPALVPHKGWLQVWVNIPWVHRRAGRSRRARATARTLGPPPSPSTVGPGMQCTGKLLQQRPINLYYINCHVECIPSGGCRFGKKQRSKPFEDLGTAGNCGASSEDGPSVARWRSESSLLVLSRTHTHTHTHTVQLALHVQCVRACMCVCVCACVCVSLSLAHLFVVALPCSERRLF